MTNLTQYRKSTGEWGGGGEMREGGQQAQTSGYKISPGSIIYSMMTVQYCIAYLKVAKEYILKFPITRKKIVIICGDGC